MNKAVSLFIALAFGFSSVAALAHPGGGGGGSSHGGGGGGSSHSSSSSGGGFHGSSGGGGFQGPPGGFHSSSGGFHGSPGGFHPGFGTSGPSFGRMPSHFEPFVQPSSSFMTGGHSAHVVTSSLGLRQIVPNNFHHGPFIGQSSQPPGTVVLHGNGIPVLTHTGVAQVGLVRRGPFFGLPAPIVTSPAGFYNPYFCSSSALYSGFLFGNGCYHRYGYYNPLFLGFSGAYGFGSAFYGGYDTYYGDAYYNGYNNGYQNGYDNGASETQPTAAPDVPYDAPTLPGNEPAPNQVQTFDGVITTITDHEVYVQGPQGAQTFQINEGTRVSQVLVAGDQVRIIFEPSSGYEPSALEILKAVPTAPPGPTRGTP